MEIGDHTIPDLGFADAREMVLIINARLENALEDTEDEEVLARSLAHTSADSGAFRAKLTALVEYGLLSSSGRALTPLAHTVIEDETRGAQRILDDYALYREAHQEFGNELPSEEEWHDFLRGMGVEVSENNRAAQRARKRYLELVRKLPADHRRESITVTASEWEATVDRLEDPRKRPYAIKALRDYANHPVRSDEAFGRLVEFVIEERATEHTDTLLRVLVGMLQTSAKRFDKDVLERIETFALTKLEESEDSDVRKEARRLLEQLYPADIDDELASTFWETATTLLEEGIKDGDESKQRTADRIVRTLAQQWIVGKADLARQFEDEIWEEIGEDETYDTFFDVWLGELRAARGIR